MHYSTVLYILGHIVRIEGALMLLPILTGIIYREQEALAYVIVGMISFLIGHLIVHFKPKKLQMFAREGLVSVALSWIVMSMIGAVPFVMTGDIPDYTDALFETISGFTTTGASILNDIEALSHTSLIWRSFTHWIGGMGVIVFMLAIIPMASGYNMQLMKAESPGPSVGKLVPRIRDSAKILYLIYFAMTAAEMIVLLLSGMAAFDAICISFGTAGTGGFGVLGDSCASYTVFQQVVITVFMLAFGVNFNAYYYALGKDWKKAFRMEEVRWYLIIAAAAVLLISLNARECFSGWGETIQQVAFQVASIMTTTGFGTTDFNLWPMFSRLMLVGLMFIGACAGSTGGGLKVSRVVILGKAFRQELRHYVHPRSVSTLRMEGKPVDKSIVRGVLVYFAAYIFVFAVSLLLLALDPVQSFETDFTAVAATINNIGPGLDAVGPSANYSGMSMFSKYVLMFDMLVGRLELFPMLVLFMPSVWKRR